MKKKKALRSKKNNQIKKVRKANLYNDARSKASKYCKDKYGRRCTNKELNDAYRETKKQNITNNKQFINKVLKNIDNFFSSKSKKNVPSELVGGFDWFYFENLLANKEINKFFKDDDEFIFGLDKIGKKDKKIKYKDIKKDYRNKIYPLLRQNAGLESPPAELDFEKDESDLNKRIFKFNLKDGDKGEKPKIISQRIDEDVEEKKEKISDSKSKELTKQLEILERFYKSGVFTKEQVRKEITKLLNKYNKGGII